ncbi:CaiB/BaiF CoA transferase family protein [Lysinibacillus sp. NPDC097195]|uniref:CaiB/BaiF CoA transferase family protein n=1 Tax=Lysinibacillus sp. NPDC097195 TaxID=3364141 RepID=UPI003810E01E
MLLNGLKVLDFSALLPGPFATMMLADLGAEVVHITKPTTGEGRWIVDDYLQRSKKSIAVNLKDSTVIDHLKALMAEYDIVVEQFRPGVMERLGLGYESLKEVNPSLIYCSISGYGQTGPYKDKGGHDINYVSLAGIHGYSGSQQQGPPNLGIQIADLAGGSLHAVVAILAAVIYRTRTGQGQHLDISMTDCALALNALAAPEFLVQGKPLEREQMMLNGGSFYGHFATQDGRYMSVGSIEPKFRQALCMAINRQDLLPLVMSYKPADELAFKQHLKEIFNTKTYAEWVEIFAKIDACVEPVLSFEETVNHPLFLARNMFVDIPQKDGTMQKQLACPIKSDIFQPVYTAVNEHLNHDSEAIVGIRVK